MQITSILLKPHDLAVMSRGVLSHLVEEDWRKWVSLPSGESSLSLPVLKRQIRRLLILGWIQHHKGDLNSVARELKTGTASLQREMHKLRITKNLAGIYE